MRRLLLSIHRAVLFGYVRPVTNRLTLLNLGNSALDTTLSHKILPVKSPNLSHLLLLMRLDFNHLQGWRAANFFNGNVPMESEGTNLLTANAVHLIIHEFVSNSDVVATRVVL